MSNDFREQFRKELGFTINSDSLCKCGFFRMQDAEYIKWLEHALEEKMRIPITQLQEGQARRMAWLACNELCLDKKEDVKVIMNIWRDKKFIK